MHNYLYICLVFVVACSSKKEVVDTSIYNQIQLNYEKNKTLLSYLNPEYAYKKRKEKEGLYKLGSNLFSLKNELGINNAEIIREKKYSLKYELEQKPPLDSARIYLNALTAITEIEVNKELNQLMKAAQDQLKFVQEDDSDWDGFNHLLLQFTIIENKLIEHYLVKVDSYSMIGKPGYMFFKDSALLVNEPTQFIVKVEPLELLDRVNIRFSGANIYSVLDSSNRLTTKVIRLDKVGFLSFTVPESGNYQLELNMIITDTITGFETIVPIKEELKFIDELWEEQILDLDSLATGMKFKAQGNYTNTKRKAKELRESLAQAYLAATNSSSKEALLDSAQNLFANYLLNKIIPYWYNTKWEFDGYTAVPQKGAIACGYFVSTTLKHMGVNVNRYKLAQQNPKNESSSVAIAHANLKKYKFDELGKDILPELSSYKDGLYFVGLDYHVGYLYIKNKQPYFIHSDYLEGYVRIESAKASSAFESYEYFISPISNNPQFIVKWLLQEEIVVKTG